MEDGGRGEGAKEGFVSIRSNGLSFFKCFYRELRIKGLLLLKREREKSICVCGGGWVGDAKPTKAVKTFGPSVGAANAKQTGGIFFPLCFLTVDCFRLCQSICPRPCVWTAHRLQ